MTSELSLELLATHQLERGRLHGGSRVEFREVGNLAIEVTGPVSQRREIGGPVSERDGGGDLLRARVWDTHTGEIVQDFPAETFLTGGKRNSAIDAAVSGDGSKLAVARLLDDTDDQCWSVRVLDTSTGEVLWSKSLDDFQGAEYVSFSGDGRFLFHGGEGHRRQWLETRRVIEVETSSIVLDLDGSTLEHRGQDFGGLDHRGTLSPNGGRVVLEDGEAAWVWSVPWSDSAMYDLGMRIPRASFGISDAEFNSDGSLVLTSGGDGSARIWNVETGTELLKLDHGRHVLRGRFSFDGSRILTACAGGAVRLWDARNGDLIAVLADGGGFESQFVFSPDGLRCATGGDEGVVRSWNSVTVEPLGEPISHPGLVSRLAFTLDGKRLVSASASEVLLSDAESGVTCARIHGKLLEISVEHDLIVVGGERFMQLRDTRDGSVVWALNRGMTHATISPDGTRLLCWDAADGDIHDFDVVSGAPVGLFGRPRQGLESTRLSFNRDGSRVLIFDPGSSAETPEFTVALCDAADGRVIADFEKATAIAFSPDGLHLWKGHELFDATDGRRAGTAQFEESGVYPLTFVTGVEFSPDGSWLILLGASDELEARIHDARTGSGVSRLTGHTARKVRPVEFDPSGNHLLTIDAGFRDASTLRVWEAQTGRELSVLYPVHHDRAGSGHFSPDSAWALTQSYCFWSDEQRRTYVYDPATGANVAVFTGDKVWFSPNGSRALAHTDGQTHVWDTGTWGELAVLPGRGAEFTSDGTRLLTSVGDETHVWDAATWSELTILQGRGTKFNPDRTRVITHCGSQIRVWDTGTWDELAVLPGGDTKFSADGARLLLERGGRTHVWDTATWIELAVLPGKNPKFSPDATRLLTRTGDQTRVWDARTWRHVAVLPGDYPMFSPDGSQLLAHGGGETHLWALLTGPEGQTLVYDPVGGSDVAVLTGDKAEFSRDGARALTSGSDQTYVWETKTWSELAVLQGKDPKFSPDGTRLLTEHGIQTRVWDLGTWSELAVLPGNDPRFSPDGTWLLTSDLAETHVWDTATWSKLAALSVFVPSRPAEFTTDGTRLFTYSSRQTRVWDTATWSELAELPDTVEALARSDGQTLVYDSATGTNVAVLTGETARFSPDGARVLTRAREQTHVWNARNWSELAVLPGRGAKFSPDGARVLSQSGGQTRVWDTGTWSELTVLAGDNAEFTPDGKRVLTNNGDQVQVWDTVTWTQRGSFPHSDSGFSPGSISNDGRYVLSTPSWQSACILDLEKGGTPTPLFGRSDRPTKVTQAKYNPDGSLILTTGDDGRIRLWDPVSGGVTVTLDAGTTAILAGAKFSPDGKTVLTACGDYSLRLWDVSSGRQLAVIDGHDSTIDAFSFNADGRQIVAISGSTLRRWGLSECAASDNRGAAA